MSTLEHLSQYGPAGVSIALLVLLLKLLWPNILQLFSKEKANDGNGKKQFIENSFKNLMVRLEKLDKIEEQVNKCTVEIFGNQFSPGSGIVGEMSRVRHAREEFSVQLAAIRLEINQLKQVDANTVSKYDLEVAFRFFREELKKEYVTIHECDLKERQNRQRNQ